MNSKILDDITRKITELLASSPAQDIEKNVRGMLQNLFSKLDLVTREEFDVQQAVLIRTREKLDALETRLAELEGKSKP